MHKRNPARKDFSELMKEAMAKRGVGVRELERLSGLDRRSIRRMREGSRVPEIETALRIARVLQIEPWLVFVSLAGKEDLCR